MAGHRLYQDLYQGAALAGANAASDPGPGGRIRVPLSPAYVGLRSAGAEMRFLEDPRATGLFLTLAMEVDNGDILVSGSPLVNSGDGEMTFNTVGDYVKLVSVNVGGDLRWRIVGQHGTGIGPA